MRLHRRATGPGRPDIHSYSPAVPAAPGHPRGWLSGDQHEKITCRRLALACHRFHKTIRGLTMPDLASWGILAAFLGGLVSFFSPCTLPLVPGYLSVVTGGAVSEASNRLKALWLSCCFVLGFSVVFVALADGLPAGSQSGGGPADRADGPVHAGLVEHAGAATGLGAWGKRSREDAPQRPFCWASPLPSAGRPASARYSEPYWRSVPPTPTQKRACCISQCIRSAWHSRFSEPRCSSSIFASECADSAAGAGR